MYSLRLAPQWFTFTSNFTPNSTVINGGAVLTAGIGVLSFNGINKFINNSANDGGAICAVTNVSLIFIGTNNFIHNLWRQCQWYFNTDHN